MATSIEPESLSTKARHVSLVQKLEGGTSALSGADAPLIMVDVNHQRNHDGRAFFAYKVYPETSKLAAGTSIDIVLASPAGVYPHLTVQSGSQGDSEFYLYEGTSTTGGTSFTPINRNRNFAISNPSDVAMVINPTVTTLGTELDAQIIPAGSGKKSASGSAATLEYVLKPLTNYLFRLTNVNGVAHPAYLNLEWYE